MIPRPLVAGRAMPDQATLADIRMLLLDVDGVLTDGRIWFDAAGTECKSFHVHDAAGMFYWHRSGGLSGFLSGRGGDVVERRARDLKITDVMLWRLDKKEAFAEMLDRQGLEPRQVAYMGDDLLDLPVLRAAGFAATVPEARAELAEAVHFVTSRSAGFGAARDVIEVLLQARGAWADVLRHEGRP
ncbi:MAG: HAD hydrolase family protein [Planctomycetes bacterium]|nr:HAD hydrolase family protein [Planctomycetota bacterium]